MKSETEPVMRQKFLEGMSHAACTVNIVTTDGPEGRAGVTVSAMASVSADTPRPSLLVCVHHLSAACKAIQANRVFCVNVLRDDQSYISDVFAGRIKTSDGDKFSCVDWTTQATGAPRVIDPLVAFDCELKESFRWGSHVIFIGETQDIHIDRGGPPLIYANRAYGTPVRLDKVVAPCAPAATRAQELSLGCYLTVGPYFLPAVLARFHEAHPEVKLRLIEGHQGQVLEALRTRACELALTYLMQLDQDIAAEPLAELWPYVLLAADDPLAAQTAVSLGDLAPRPMVLFDVPPGQQYFPSLFKDAGLAPNIAFRSVSFEMVRGLVGHGLGYSLLATKPASNMTYDGRALAVRPLADDVEPSRLILASVAGRDLSDAAQAFGAACRSYFA